MNDCKNDAPQKLRKALFLKRLKMFEMILKSQLESGFIIIDFSEVGDRVHDDYLKKFEDSMINPKPMGGWMAYRQ